MVIGENFFETFACQFRSIPLKKGNWSYVIRGNAHHTKWRENCRIVKENCAVDLDISFFAKSMSNDICDELEES